MRLTWTLSSEADFAKYRLYRGTSPGVDTSDTLVATLLCQEQSFYDDKYPLSPSTTYYYKVYVVDQTNQSTASNEVSAGTLADDPPSVSITSPEPSASVGGKHVPVEISATDETYIGKLQLLVDGQMDHNEIFDDRPPGGPFHPLTSGTWTMYWDASDDTAGEHTLQVKAYDLYRVPPGASNCTTSSSVTVTVTNPDPTVSIISPIAGDTVAGAAVPVVAEFSATSPSTSGVVTLELYVDGGEEPVATKSFVSSLPAQSGPPGPACSYPQVEGRYTFSWDSTAHSNASHTLTVKAIDEQDNDATSSGQSVTVDNTSENVPPNRVLLDDPFDVTDTELNLAWSQNQDTDFGKYEVHQSTTQSFTPDANTLVATLSSQSQNHYHVSNLSASTTYYFKVKVYDDAETPLSVVSNEVSATTRSTGNDLPEVTVIRYTYDKVGQRATMTDPFGTTSYTYNASGELTQVKDPKGHTVSYQYDDAGNRTQMTDQFDGVTGYTYNAADLLTKVTDPDDNDTNYTYDDNGRRTRMDLPNGTYTTYTYNDRSWLTAITHKKSEDSTFLSFSYEYDDCGNTTKCTENNGDVTDFAYDARYRLTRETKKDDEEELLYDYSYEYDAVGNRTKKTDEETETETDYTYNNMNEMTAAGNITCNYDDAGNMVTKVVNEETITYVWDFRNKMVEADFPTSDDPAMRYDGDGTRIRKVLGGATTNYLYDPDGGFTPPLLFETDGSDDEVAEYRGALRGGPVVMQRTGSLWWQHSDALGSTRAMTDSSEAVTDTYTYDAWGNLTGSAGSTANPFEFAGAHGYYGDDDVGLTLLFERWYTPSGGRFVSVDPVRIPPNVYAYVDNSPANHVDPTGLFSCDICDVLCGGAREFAWECVVCHLKCTPNPPKGSTPHWKPGVDCDEWEKRCRNAYGWWNWWNSMALGGMCARLGPGGALGAPAIGGGGKWAGEELDDACAKLAADCRQQTGG